jgi:Ca2+/Na+ antiporter
MAARSSSATTIGWGRALVSAVVILVVGAVLFVFAPNWLLTHLTGLSRNGRVAVVTTAFVVVFVAFAWALRRLQARRVI